MNDYHVTDLVRSKKNSLNEKTHLKLLDDIKTCNFKDTTNGFDLVVHLAALVHQPDQSDIQEYMDLYYHVTISLTESCITNNVRKFITLSTPHVYEGIDILFTESS